MRAAVTVMLVSGGYISKYLSFFEEAYVIYRANKYDVKGSRYFSTPLKYYVADIGFRNAWGEYEIWQ